MLLLPSTGSTIPVDDDGVLTIARISISQRLIELGRGLIDLTAANECSGKVRPKLQGMIVVRQFSSWEYRGGFTSNAFAVCKHIAKSAEITRPMQFSMESYL